MCCHTLYWLRLFGGSWCEKNEIRNMEEQDKYYYHNRLIVNATEPLPMVENQFKLEKVMVTIDKVKLLTNAKDDTIEIQVSFKLVGIGDHDLHVQTYSISKVDNLYVSNFDFASASVQKLKLELMNKLRTDENEVNVEVALPDQAAKGHLSLYDTMLLTAMKRGDAGTIDIS